MSDIEPGAGLSGRGILIALGCLVLFGAIGAGILSLLNLSEPADGIVGSVLAVAAIAAALVIAWRLDP